MPRIPKPACRRFAMVAVGAAVATGVAVAPATAGPVASAPVVSAGQHLAALHDVGFDVAFALGIQVYERVGTAAIADAAPGSTYRLMVLRRLPSAAAGVPTAAHYAFVGAPLPATVEITEDTTRPGLLGDLATQPPGGPLELDFRLQRPIGPFADAAVVAPRLGR